MENIDPIAVPGRAKGTSLLGNLTFVCLRSADFFLQLYFLRQYPLSTMGGSYFGLSPYYSVVAFMALVASIRHVFWKLYITEQVLPLSFAFIVSAFNTAFNGLNVMMSFWNLKSNAIGSSKYMFDSPTRTIGLGLFVMGSLLETCSELQRKEFKDDQRNAGKLYTSGLFSLARHINFGGYMLWRVGFATFCGGWSWGVVVLGYFLGYFSFVGVPDIDKYLAQRVGCPYASMMKSCMLIEGQFSTALPGRSMKERRHTISCLRFTRRKRAGHVMKLNYSSAASFPHSVLNLQA